MSIVGFRTFALALTLLGSSLACTTGDGTVEDHPALDLTGDVATGTDVFANNCAGCHGADGDSGSAPNLSEVAPDRTDNEIAWTIADGNGGMPSIDIDDQAIADVIAFLRSEFN